MAWVGTPTASYVVGSGALVAGISDIVRACVPAFNQWIRRTFGFMMRTHELSPDRRRVSFNGATWVLVGATVLAVFFPLRVAVPVLTMTILSDAAAAIIGRRWGHHPWGSLPTTMEGTAAFVGTGIFAMLTVGTLATGPALAGVMGGALVEALPVGLNDNVGVPVVAALCVVGVEALL